jgi:hypothetical protein
MTFFQDIKSERFIHDSLLKRAEDMLEAVRRSWNQGEEIDPLVVSWPGEGIRTDDGRLIDGPCIGNLRPVLEKKRPAAIAEFARRTKAYGLLFIEPRAKVEVRAVFETPHGAREWSIALERHGDVWLATRPVALPPPGEDRLFLAASYN